jgi:guanylate kinase
MRTTDHNSLFIFISPPSHEVLEQRLRDRKTDTESTIKNRLLEANESMKFSKEPGVYDHIIENDQLDIAFQKLKEVLSKVILRQAFIETVPLSSFSLFSGN